MDKTERINVRGAIKALEVGGNPLVLPRPDYVPSMVRSTAGSVTVDTGRRFKIEVGAETIRVTRKS